MTLHIRKVTTNFGKRYNMHSVHVDGIMVLQFAKTSPQGDYEVTQSNPHYFSYAAINAIHTALMGCVLIADAKTIIKSHCA